MFDDEKKAVHFNHKNRGMDRMPSIEKKRLLRKKYREYLSSKKLNRRKIVGRSLLTELNKLERLNLSYN